MPPALQVVNFFKQNLAGGGGYEDLSVGSGDPAAFAVVPTGSIAYLADLRAVDDASPCEVSVVAQGFADQILGIAGWVPDGSTLAPPNRSTSISPPGADQPIQSGDVPTVQVKGTAADNVNATAIIYHSDLPGVDAYLRAAPAVKNAIHNILGVDVAADASSVAQGDWSTPVSISAASRRLNANKWYALMGFTSDVPCAAVGVSAFETGNLKVGGPSIADGDHDASLIYDLAVTYGAALIPVFNGANQDNVLVYVADPAATNVNLTIMLAELTGRI